MTAEPTTEAGRALLLVHIPIHQRDGRGGFDPDELECAADLEDWPCPVVSSVLAIEAEARAAERRRIAEAVRGLERGKAQARIGVMYADIEVVDLADVLAIIERQPVSQADLTDRVASA